VSVDLEPRSPAGLASSRPEWQDHRRTDSPFLTAGV